MPWLFTAHRWIRCSSRRQQLRAPQHVLDRHLRRTFASHAASPASVSLAAAPLCRWPTRRPVPTVVVVIVVVIVVIATPATMRALRTTSSKRMQLCCGHLRARHTTPIPCSPSDIECTSFGRSIPILAPAAAERYVASSWPHTSSNDDPLSLSAAAATSGDGLLRLATATLAPSSVVGATVASGTK